MKKIGIVLIVGMFIISMLPGVVGEKETNEYTITARIFIENRDAIPIYTAHGLVKAPGGRGKPEVIVDIINPSPGETVSGICTITINSNGNPSIKIDGTVVGKGTSYDWDTTQYGDGSHTIEASLKGNTDTVTVTVDNNGGGGGYGEEEKYALVIGISDYRGVMNDLQYCDDDAREWKSFLQNNGYTVKTLIDRQAKANKIVAEINNLLALEDGNDHVVVTYSGHGAKVSGYGSCILSHELTYITHGWFESKFSNADSPHIYFTFDACEIGDFSGLITSNRVGAFASNNELSWETSEFENGVFTYYQMDGWNTYDNFEDDGTYAAGKMEDWASGYGLTVDPFVDDNYDGYMYP
jgi:hypothetical protein